jgi:ribonuclease HI
MPNIKNTLTKTISSIPPWSDMSEYVVTNLPTTLHNNEKFSDYISENYVGFQAIFTDGSKIEHPRTSVGAAMYCPEASTVQVWKLDPQHSVVSAELYAINKALEEIASDSGNQRDSIIFTDSLTSLQMISSKACTYFKITENIKTILKKLNETIRVKLHWVKGHADIKGNVIADAAALKSHENTTIEDYPLHKEEVLSILQLKSKSHWNEYWHRISAETKKGQFHAKIQNCVHNPTPVRTKCRKTNIIIHRLRMGHVGVNSHLFRFSLADSALCEHCEEEETIEHYLLKCEEFYPQRLQLYDDIRCILCTDDMPEITVKLLLGGEKFNHNVNCQIVTALGKFIKRTRRIGKM